MNTEKLIAIVIAFVTGGYLLPFSIALWRNHPAMTKVFFVNLLLGWTIIGWVIAFIWALR